MAHADSPSQRWRRRKEARPDEIIEAALELFTEQGFVATKLDDIARHAGISKGTLYLYFDSKEAMFRAMVQRVILPHVDEAEQLVSGHTGSQRELLERFVWNWWEVVAKTRLSAIPKLMVSECAHFPELAQFYVENVVNRVKRLLATIVTRGIEKGEFKRVEVDNAVRVLIAPLVFAVIWERSLAPFDTTDYSMEAYVKTHLQLFFDGLEA